MIPSPAVLLQVLHALDLHRDRLEFGPAHGAPERPAVAVRAVRRQRREVLAQDQLDPPAHGVDLVARS